MSYCNLCNNLTIAGLYPPSIYYHAENISALEKSGLECQLCALLLRVIKAAKGPEESEYSTRFRGSSPDIPLLVGASDVMFDREVEEEVRNVEKDDIDFASDEFRIKLQILEETQRKRSTVENLNGFTHIGIWTRARRMLSSLTVMVEEGDEMGFRAITLDNRDRFISGRLLTINHPPKAYFQVAQRWLEVCDEEHPDCGSHSNMTSKIPDRVIDVALDGGSLKLKNGTGIIGRYATLSHCWGGSSPMMTLVNNLEQRMSNIPIADLPKTFREAVEVCRALNIPYLWIDSICIVQDSPNDWQLQSREMHSIYHNSTLTLVALDAVDSTQGLFIPKVPCVDVVPLSPVFGNYNGQAYVGPPTWSPYNHSPGPFLNDLNRYRGYLNNALLGNSNIQLGHLETRGWAMQELRLSRRALYFFKGEMMWKCTKTIKYQNGCCYALETMTHLSDTLRRFGENFGLIRKMLEERGQNTHKKNRVSCSSDGVERGGERATIDTEDLENERFKSSESGDDFQEMTTFERNKAVFYTFINLRDFNIQAHWYSIVKDYCTTRLTFPDDKLPALSGIASRFHSITKDDYVAGHWRIDLERSLFWHGGDTFRAKSYRAPSWSWASIEGELFTSFDENPTEYGPLDCIELLDVEIHVEKKNPFGRVSSGKIVARVNTIEARWDPEQYGWSSRCSSGFIHKSNGYPLTIFDHDGYLIGHWRYDDELYGVMPGPRLTSDAGKPEIKARLITNTVDAWNDFCEDEPTTALQPAYQKEAGDVNLFWTKATYLPENLLLVKGPKTKCREDHRLLRGKELDVSLVLVLRKTQRDKNEYERVGIGRLSWDESVEITQTLTII